MTVRGCAVCQADISALHFNTRYCSRSCKDVMAYRVKFNKDNPNYVSKGRECAWCGGNIDHKKSHAHYCDRTCKIRAGTRRAVEDGRNREKDRVRYAAERHRRVPQARAYYYLTKDRRREMSRAWRRANPDKRKVQQAARRALKYGNPGYVRFDAKAWLQMQRRFDFRCAYCGVKSFDLTIDHIIPLARGGRHAEGNITPACLPCNTSKQDKFLIEWRHRLLY